MESITEKGERSLAQRKDNESGKFYKPYLAAAYGNCLSETGNLKEVSAAARAALFVASPGLHSIPHRTLQRVYPAPVRLDPASCKTSITVICLVQEGAAHTAIRNIPLIFFFNVYVLVFCLHVYVACSPCLVPSLDPHQPCQWLWAAWCGSWILCRSSKQLDHRTISPPPPLTVFMEKNTCSAFNCVFLFAHLALFLSSFLSRLFYWRKKPTVVALLAFLRKKVTLVAYFSPLTPCWLYSHYTQQFQFVLWLTTRFLLIPPWGKPSLHSPYTISTDLTGFLSKDTDYGICKGNGIFYIGYIWAFSFHEPLVLWNRMS